MDYSLYLAGVTTLWVPFQYRKRDTKGKYTDLYTNGKCPQQHAATVAVGLVPNDDKNTK